VRDSLIQKDRRAYQKWKEARIEWEWNFFQEALSVEGIIWPNEMDSEKAALVEKSQAFLDTEWDGYVRGKTTVIVKSAYDDIDPDQPNDLDETLKGMGKRPI
jgi:Zn-dependent M32 family carboxypeptidase